MTEVTKTVPAYNPADANTLSGLNNILQDKLSMNIECAIPGIFYQVEEKSACGGKSVI